MVFGQPGFFSRRTPGPWLAATGSADATSYYDSAPLKATLLDLVDFGLINSKSVRFAVGAVNVVTGNFAYFDNEKEEIRPEHVMASGALPPALPAIRIGTDHYWDGGLVSNTPLQHLLDKGDEQNSLVFQVDLFSARGLIPRDIQDVMARQKDIVYSSRTRYNTDVYRELQGWKTRLYEALTKVPEDRLTNEERQLRQDLRNLREMTIIQLIYQQRIYEGHAKDYEFSAASMLDHWQSGYEDTRRTLDQKDWLELPPEGGGIWVHDVHRKSE